MGDIQTSTPPHTKHIASGDNIRILHACTHRHASSQYFVACKGLIYLYVTMTIHTAHAQKHFSPETKSKVRPKKITRLGVRHTLTVGQSNHSKTTCSNLDYDITTKIQTRGRDLVPLKALGQYISGIRLLNLNTAITEQVNGNSTT